MQSFIVFTTLSIVAVSISAVSAHHLPVGAITTGTSSQFRSEDNYGNYNFGYDESHSTGGSSRREEQTNGVRRGSYSLSDADGRRRVVNYIADANGFRATIQTNEPGVEPKDPADTLINKQVAPAVAVAVAPAPLPAPVFSAPAAPVLALPAPVGAVKGIFDSRQDVIYRSPVLAAAPAPVYGPAPAAVIEAETPRAFSYSFGSTHSAPAYVAAPVAAPVAAAPIYQQQAVKY